MSEGSLPPRLLFVNNLRISLFVTRGLPADSPYFYVAKAVSAKGTESTASSEIRVDISSP